MGFYDDMQQLATGLVTEFQQGTVTVSRSEYTTPNPDEPWNRTERVTEHDLAATVKPVERRYVDGSLIVGTEYQVTFAVPADFTPAMIDRFALDGKAMTVKRLFAVPPAGTPVAYVALVES